MNGVLDLATGFATSFVVHEESFRTSYSQLIDSPNAYIAIAEHDGQIVGYILGFEHLTFYANGRVAWVEEIMVHESFRRQGIGEELMFEFEA